MSRLPGTLLIMAALLAVLAAHAQPVRSVGLVVDASTVTNPLPFARFVDVLVESIASSRKWEPTVLVEDCPLVKIAAVAWPAAGKGDWMARADELHALLAGTRLDNLLLVLPVPSAASTVDVLWLQADKPGLQRLQLSVTGGGDQASAALARQLLARLEQGFETTLAAAPATTKPAPTEVPKAPTPAPEKPLPAAPVAPEPVAAPPGAPVTPAATRPDVAAAPPTAPTAPTPAKPVELTKPDVAPATPGAERPDTAAPTPPVAPAPTVPVQPVPEAPEPAAKPGEEPAARALSEYFKVAEQHLAEGEFKEVEHSLVKALDAGDPRAQVYYLYARLEAARQNPVAERTWLERTVAEDAGNMAAHLRLAELLRGAGLWRKAIEEYQLVLKAEPTNLYAYLGMSAIYANQSQPRRAAEVIAEAVKHYPNDASLYLRMGDLHAGRRALAEAEDAYDHAARLQEGTAKADALERLGDLYVSAERHHEGFICYAEASRLRSGGTSPLAEKRYQQIMAAGDEALLKSLEAAREAMRGYQTGAGIVREEAFQAMNDFDGEAKEVDKFAETIVPPSTLKLLHQQRQVAYSLAAEAAAYGIAYVDHGGPTNLERYQARLDEALKSLQAVGKLKGL